MKENQDKKKNNKLVAVIAIATLLVGVIGATYAYFVSQIGPAATANVTLTTGTNDVVTFSTGSAITIGPLTQANFGSGAGDKSGTTTAVASLKANNQANVATSKYCYKAYLTITTNNLVYTSGSTPELVLNVVKRVYQNKSAVTTTGTATSTTNLITNKDITTGTTTVNFPTTADGSTTSVGKHTFLATTKNLVTTDVFDVTVTFKNLNSDQQLNTGKTFSAVIHIENMACS